MTKLDKIKEIKDYLTECEMMSWTCSIELRVAIQRALNEAYIEYLYEVDGTKTEDNEK